MYFLKIHLKGQNCKEVFWCSTRLHITLLKIEMGHEHNYIFCILYNTRILDQLKLFTFDLHLELKNRPQ